MSFENEKTLSSIRNILSIIDSNKESFKSQDYIILCQELKSTYESASNLVYSEEDLDGILSEQNSMLKWRFLMLENMKLVNTTLQKEIKSFKRQLERKSKRVDEYHNRLYSTCGCKSIVLKSGMKRHLDSTKHLKYLEGLVEN